VVAECLGELLRAPDEIGTDGLVATVSIGVAIGPDGLKTADDVVAAADAAMYDAKRRGGGRCVICREDLHGRRGPDDPASRSIDRAFLGPLAWKGAAGIGSARARGGRLLPRSRAARRGAALRAQVRPGVLPRSRPKRPLDT